MKKILRIVGGSIQKIFRLMVHDFVKVFTNPVAAIIAIGVLILPSLYAWFNIKASWDPYGSTNNLSVAVANVDEGTTIQGIDLNVGDSIIESLAENDQIGWKFTNKQKAIAGVRSGEYYAAVIIPEDFSEDMSSILRPEIDRPKIEYYVNEKKNAIAPKITDKGVGVIQQMVNETFISQSVTVLGDTVLGLAAEDDSALNRKLLDNVSVEDDIQNVNDSIAALTELNESMDDMVATIEAFQATGEAMNELQNIVVSTVDSMNEVAQGVQSEDSGDSESMLNMASSFADSCESSLNGMSTTLDSMYKDLEKLEQTIASQEPENAIPVLDSLKSQAQTLLEINNKLITILKGNTYLYANQSVKELVASLEQLSTHLNTYITATDQVITNIKESTKQEDTLAQIAQMKETIQNCQNQVNSAKTLFDDDTRAQIASVITEVDTKVGTVQEAAASLKAIGPSAKATMESVNKAMASLGTSMESMSKVLTNSKTLITNGIDELEEMKGLLEEIQQQKHMTVSQAIQDFVLQKFGVDLNDYQNSPESIGEFLSAPVELDTHKVFPIENYGSALSPFYSILAMWVGGLVLVSILKCRAVNDKKLDLAGYRPFELYIGRYLIFMIFGIIQSVIICLGDLYLLHIQCLYPGRFIFVGVVSGIVFSNIIYTLTITFDDVGKAIAVIMLVLQVAGAGGTFPIEVTPGFFNMINPFLPFTHGMNAMRDAVAGLYGHNYVFSLLKLFVYFPIFFVFGTVFRTPLIKINEFFAKHVEDTGIM